MEKYKDLEKKLCNYIISNINKLKLGYDVLEYKIEYDRSIITTFNGFTGTFWEIDKIMKNDINAYLNHILTSGLKYKDAIYFLDKKKFRKNNIVEKNIVITMIR
tara:strand:+ start:286 stop:597 length:312 start_codon:yes stop_codon:yes gene_type:complete